MENWYIQRGEHMKRKHIYFTIGLSVLFLSGCKPKTVSSSERVTYTPTVATEETVTPTESVIPTKAETSSPEVQDTNSTEEVENLKKENSESYWLQNIISLPSEDYQWDMKQLIPLLNEGKIVEISNGMEFKTEYGEPLKISFEFQEDPEYEDEFIKYSLTVNGSTISDETLALTNKVYMASLDHGRSYQFIIEECGYDAASSLHIFLYDDIGLKLNRIGVIPGGLLELTICEDGTFTSSQMARSIETWWYNKKYMVSNYGISSDYETFTPPVIAALQPEMYPIGTPVVTKMDLPLLACRTDSKASITVPAGTNLVLCSSDDTMWLYVSTPVNTPEEEAYAGYVRLGDYSTFIINGKKVLCTDVFEGLHFAG